MTAPIDDVVSDVTVRASIMQVDETFVAVVTVLRGTPGNPPHQQAQAQGRTAAVAACRAVTRLFRKRPRAEPEI